MLEMVSKYNVDVEMETVYHQVPKGLGVGAS